MHLMEEKVSENDITQRRRSWWCLRRLPESLGVHGPGLPD